MASGRDIVDRRQRSVALLYLTDLTITVPELAKIFRARTSEVRAWLDAELVPEHRDRWDGPWTRQELDMARRMFEVGWTLAEAAERFGVAPRTLRRAARSAGVGAALWPSRTEGKPANRPPGPVHRNYEAAVERFRQGGVTVPWLSAEFAASRDTIRKWLIAAGLDPANPPTPEDQS